MIDWKPIGTALKDGTDILLYGVNDWREQGGDLVEWYEVGFWGECYLDEPGWTEDRDRAPLNPTHWAELNSPKE